MTIMELIKRGSGYSRIGLDIGETAIRAAQLSRRGDRWMVSLLGSWRMPSRGAAAPADSDAPARAARWLRQLDWRRRVVVAGLSPPDVELHAMELPRTGEPAQEAQAARWELDRLTGFEEGAAETAYWGLPESKMMSATAIGVAALRPRLDSALELCRAARLDCARIDVLPCALARFAALLRDPTGGGDEVWGVLDLGARSTRLIVCVDETPVLARAFDYGGRQWTQKLAESLSVSPETAERHKCDHGVTKVARGAGAGEAGPSPVVHDGRKSTAAVLGEMIFNVLRADLEAIVSEIERSYRYVMQCYPRRRPGALVLTGGGAGLRRLDALLAEKLGIEVLIPQADRCRREGRLVLDEVDGQMREPLGCFAGAIGLAIAED